MNIFIKLTIARGYNKNQPIYLNVNKISKFYSETVEENNEKKVYSCVDYNEDAYTYVKESLNEIQSAIEEARNNAFADLSSEIAASLWNKGIGL